LINYQTFFFN